MKYKLKTGDNLQILKNLPDNSIDAVITDPPYGLSFMNKKWDYEVPSVELWKEVLRVLKPGGHLLSFGGTRTYHRLVVNIEDAGFEIRDQIQWIYGSGFPKSHNIGKAIDKLQGNEREIIGTSNNINFDNKKEGDKSFYDNAWSSSHISRKDVEITKGTSPYEGWGTALKPANEPICLARKPLSEKSVAENVIKWRTGGINIDKSRIGSEIIKQIQYDRTPEHGGKYGNHSERSSNGVITQTEGRFPANIILECCCAGEKGEPFSYVGKEYNNNNLEDVRSIDFLKGSKSEGPSNYNDKADIHTNPLCACYILDEQSGIVNQGQKSGASRFFYVAKVSKKERNMGLDGFDDKKGGSMEANIGKTMQLGGASLKGEHKEIQATKNTHPTLKPINLMTYLCNLITPEGGTILDPFMGSGSTGIAALLQRYNFLGIDMDPEYTKIAEGRISNYEKYRDLLKK